MKKAHAIHNEEVCNFLFANSEFYDWVITTAFYSALHYVHHEIFPVTIGTFRYENCEDYFSFLQSLKEKNINKHSETLRLVQNYIPKALRYYRSLFDLCKNARYHDYNIGKKKAVSAKEALINIKKYLVK